MLSVSAATVQPVVEAETSTLPILTFPLLSLKDCQPALVCVAGTSFDSVVASFCNKAVETSAYAERIFASSVASLAFSSCVVKIGILFLLLHKCSLCFNVVLTVYCYYAYVNRR